MEQSKRIDYFACALRLTPLITHNVDVPVTSQAYLSAAPFPAATLHANGTITFAKYYNTIANLPCATGDFNRLVNIPTHPDLARLTDKQITKEIHRVTAPSDKSESYLVSLARLATTTPPAS